jgi:hypothetical protein
VKSPGVLIRGNGIYEKEEGAGGGAKPSAAGRRSSRKQKTQSARRPNGLALLSNLLGTIDKVSLLACQGTFPGYFAYLKCEGLAKHGASSI